MKELLSRFLSLNRAALKVSDLRFLQNGPYSFFVRAGEIVGICGESGVGKSQLLKAIADITPHDGIVSLNDKPSSSFLPNEWRRKVGMVAAEPVWWHESVGEHFPPLSKTQFPLIEALTYLGFGREVLDWSVRRLSSGEKQRLSLLRTMVYVPDVLLLDEPTANLGDNSRMLIEELLHCYLSVTLGCIVLVSHDKYQLHRMCDNVYTLTANELHLNKG